MSTPKRVLLVTRPLVPPWDEASKNFAYFLAKSIRDPEIEFHLLTDHESLAEMGENVVSHPIYQSGDFDFFAKMRLIAFLAHKGNAFDVVHFLFTPTPLNSSFLKMLFRNHPHTIQTIATLREERWGIPEWKRMCFATRLITYTEHSRKMLEEAGYRNVETISPGIDLERFSPGPKDAVMLRALTLTPSDFVVSYAGEYARLGATDMIADMLIEKLRGRDPSSERFRFLFALRVKNQADREKKESIRKKFEEAGILDFIRWSDTVSDMPALYRVADIVTFPVHDLFGKFDVPLVILEAYASGKPVILSDLPRFSEFSNPEICATIPRGDGEAFWNMIERLRHDPEKRNALSNHARAFVENSFNLSETAEKYRQLYTLAR